MDSVQYLEMRPQLNTPTFTPGHGIPQSCLTPPGPDIAFICILVKESYGQATLRNVTEYMKTAENQSDYNQVYLSGGQAVLGPSKPPPDLGFWATSFGSQTSCEIVTNTCYFPDFTFINPSINLYGDFNCTTAGLNLTGSFSDLDKGSAPYGLISQYYNDTQKLHQVDGGETLVDQGSTQILWGLVFELQFLGASLGPIYGNNLTDPNPTSFGLVTQPSGVGAGILSCETNLSEIVSKSV